MEVSPGLVVKGEDSCSEGHGLEFHILDVYWMYTGCIYWMYILDVYFITLNCCKKSKNFNSCIAILKQDKNVFLLAVYNETTEAKLNSKMATIDNQVL